MTYVKRTFFLSSIVNRVTDTVINLYEKLTSSQGVAMVANKAQLPKAFLLLPV
jgi:hypothetical protein